MPAKRLIPYPEQRALEDAAYARGATPTRIIPLLLPVWSVEVEATITDGQPYDLIDRYLERGIAEGGLDNAADLARFFSLDETLVDRALRVLVKLGHVTIASDGRVTLTDIGHRSVRDRVRYTVERHDRRRLYFDAFASRPLTRPYYDPSTVMLLSLKEALDQAKRRDGPKFSVLSGERPFRMAALAELAGLAERDRFNLPERVDMPVLAGEPETVYLPIFAVRAVEPGGRTRCFAYTRAGDTADDDVTAICEGSREVVVVLENEEADARGGRDERKTQEYLRNRGLADLRPIRLDDGTLRVTFPARCFQANGARGQVPLSKLGSFVVLGNDFFHVWCADERVRRDALLKRVDSYLTARLRAGRDDVAHHAGRIGRQLGLGEISLPELRALAATSGNQDLVAHLDRL
ncbi:hypothetical protein [Actinomadura rayongensis]|uniref:Uncharacterized protein n=1 Tax=Actinomadura rayongensis TaxID=1429076 RepID=A0A6I4WB11_9ACTN|nr:hypothetical protein [Actinomadura rayongensis]MXQ65960.1 hypothetical protein [Actinomadura rayongensis]